MLEQDFEILESTYGSFINNTTIPLEEKVHILTAPKLEGESERILIDRAVMRGEEAVFRAREYY